MKVILLRDVAKVGRKAQVVEVPEGYAANMLIPRKLAVPATAENLKRHSAETTRVAANTAHVQEAFRTTLAALREKVIVYPAQANAQGHLFKGVRASDIARRLAEEGYSVGERAILLPQPIKELGVYTITLKQDGTEGQCTVEIIKQ